VIPAKLSNPPPQALAQVRGNILKGRYRRSGWWPMISREALISAVVLEQDAQGPADQPDRGGPVTWKIEVPRPACRDPRWKSTIIGFRQGGSRNIADGALSVVLFAVVNLDSHPAAGRLDLLPITADLRAIPVGLLSGCRNLAAGHAQCCWATE